MTAQRESSPYTRTELVWAGKRTEVERVALPFQRVETVNAPRGSDLFSTLENVEAWRNRLTWGDNKLVMASLLVGDANTGIEPLAGKIDLIYIDPPFDTGADFRFSVNVGDEPITKEPSILEQTAYRDTWGRGTDTYLQMMRDRISLMRDMLSAKGSIYVHVDWRMESHVRLLMDEVFGSNNHRNSIIWKRAPVLGRKAAAEQYGRVTDTILFYSKASEYTFNRPYIEKEVDVNQFRWDPVQQSYFKTSPRGDYTDESIARLEAQNRIHRTETGGIRIKYFLDRSASGKWIERLPSDSLWLDIPDMMHIPDAERTDFPTQKPAALLDRVIRASSSPGDLVADFFCGSGTTAAVAHRLGRRWIACDLGRFAVHTTRKRLLDAGATFDVLNLGKYERARWQGATLGPQLREYVNFLLDLYRAEPVLGYRHLHGQKAGRAVHVGAVDAPVTFAELDDVLREARETHTDRVDILGWEWEMGVNQQAQQRAEGYGVTLRLLQIPNDVMDKRAAQKGDVKFYGLAYIEAEVAPIPPPAQPFTVQVKLTDFVIPDLDLIPPSVRDKVQKWSDYIDYWAVDFDYREDTFRNGFQAFRTRARRTLETASATYTYESAGTYTVVVKVVDVFGIDSTKRLEVTV